MCMWRAKNDSQKLILSFPHVGPGNGSQAARLSGTLLCQLIRPLMDFKLLIQKNVQTIADDFCDT